MCKFALKLLRQCHLNFEYFSNNNEMPWLNVPSKDSPVLLVLLNSIIRKLTLTELHVVN